VNNNGNTDRNGNQKSGGHRWFTNEKVTRRVSIAREGEIKKEKSKDNIAKVKVLLCLTSYTPINGIGPESIDHTAARQCVSKEGS